MFKSIKNNFAFQTIEYALIDIVSKMFKVLFIPALAYLIDKNTLGQFSLFMALIPFITLGLGLNVPNFFSSSRFKKTKKYRKSIFNIYILIQPFLF